MSSTTLPAFRRDFPAAAAAGAIIWLDALLVRLLFRTDGASVWFLGQQIAWVCSFRARTGRPCPTCGLTRSVVMTLHGDLAGAWSIAPSGVVWAAGVLGVGTGLLFITFFPQWKPAFRRVTLLYAGAATIFWLVDWWLRFTAAG